MRSSSLSLPKHGDHRWAHNTELDLIFNLSLCVCVCVCVFSSVHTHTCMYAQCTRSGRDWKLVLYFLCKSRGLNSGQQPGRKYLFTLHTFTPAPQPHLAKLHLELTDLGRLVGQQAWGILPSPLRAGIMSTYYNTGLLNAGSADETHILHVQGKHFTHEAIPSLSPAFHLLHVSSSFYCLPRLSEF